MEEANLFFYPPDTVGSNNEGYFHRLNKDQQDALSTLKKRVAEKKLDMAKLAVHILHPTLILLRYLRANGFDPDLAMTHMTANVEWRKGMKVDELVKMTPEEILGCSMDSITRVFPHWHCGTDFTGRPVLYKQYGKFDVGKLKTITSMDAVMKYHVWEQEACQRLCIEQSMERGVIIETCSAVLDVQDMKLSQVTREFLTLVKGIAAIDKDQYPETLGKLFIINVPSVFPLVWRTVQFFLDPATAAKIEIFGAKKDWLPALTAQIGLENMPSTYGGLLPALSSEVHPYAETMIQYEKTKETTATADENTEDKELPSNGSMTEEKGHEHDDEIDMYIRRGQLATEALRLQGLSATPPPTDSWKTQPLKMIMSAFSPQKEQSSSHGITDVDSIAIDLSPAMSQAKNAEEDVGKEKSVSSRPGSKRWSREFQYSHGYDMNSPTSQLDQLEASNSYSIQGENEVEKVEYRRPWTGIWGCKTLNRIPGVSKVSRFLLAAFRFLTLERWVSKRSLKQIRKYLFFAVSGYMLAALTAMVVSAYLVSETLWSSSVAVYVHLWTGVVVLLVSVVMMTINLAAYIGCYYQNRALLVMYAGIVGAGSFVFCVVAIASFLYASYPSVSNAAITLDATFKDRNSVASRAVREYDFGLGGGCIMAALLAIVPLRLACTMAHRLGKVQEKKVHPRQLRAVLRVAQCISLCAALVMLSYGGVSLHYLFQINFAPTVFALFGLVYCGVTIVLTAVTGLWVASTAHKDVVFYYYMILLPMLTVLLLAASGVSLSGIAGADKDVNDIFDLLLLPSSGKGSTALDVLVAVDTQLLVAGVLCVFACLFQMVSLVASRSLYRAMVKQEGEGDGWLGCGEGGRLTMHRLRERDALLNGLAANNLSKQNILGKLNFQNKREAVEKYVIVWAIAMAFYHIYFHGTFVIFSSIIGSDQKFGKDHWMNHAWQLLGKADTRYINSDPYLVCMHGILALAVGPLLLVFAWATYVRAPHRHLSGITACIVMIYTTVLYFTVEMTPREGNFQFNKNPAGTTALIVLDIFFGVALPMSVLWRECYNSMRGTSRADTQQLLLLVNSNPSTGYGNESMKGNIAASLKTVDSKYSVSHSNGNGSGPVIGPNGSGGNSVSSVRVRHQSTSNFSDSVNQGDRDTEGAVSHRVSFDYGVGNVEDNIDSVHVDSFAFSQSNPSHQTPTIARQRTKSTPAGFMTPREGVTLSKRSIPQSLGAFRERPLYSDHDVPLPGNGSEQYSEPDNVPDSNRKKNGWSPKPRERASLDPYMRDRERERERERDEMSSSCYTGSIASLSEGNRAPSKTSDKSKVSVSALLKLHIRSQPIDISNRRHSSATTAAMARGGRSDGTAPRYERDEECGSEEERERERDGGVSRFSTSRRFTIGGLPPPFASTAASTSVRAGAEFSTRAGSVGGPSGGSGVSHEALLTALTMSMDKDASSLAMVV